MFPNRRLLSPTKKTNSFLITVWKTILQNSSSSVASCGKCKLCPQIKIAKLITDEQLNISEKSKGIRNCKEREVIYVTHYSKHKVLCIGHTGKQISERFFKHRYDIKNRPDKSEFENLFHKSHNINDSLNITILQNNIKTAAARRYHEDKWIN